MDGTRDSLSMWPFLGLNYKVCLYQTQSSPLQAAHQPLKSQTVVIISMKHIEPGTNGIIKRNLIMTSGVKEMTP